ncbi:ArsA-related P-loop ATPase [Nocardioides sp. zg-1228]|uniref:ArsA-related P-loop ATPase n=1 Tax=Nocardioides sp. zg-1228 TaxID=2763008 RepID=UPI0016433CA0|nr:ArsA-related P-loop ATPase [Nocardioides sp. zg-1228]MBC2932404.1 ArsA family ATPase [Nocardioides sp. zg-1228]QSF57916.1 ArsA family ATPase [Nocardioides sp. zg-1228]
MCPRADHPSDWPKVRLHVVTGKGGTGKSTVAAALALALAGEGRTVLLCEVEGRQGIARMFDVDPLPYQERRIAKGAPGDGGRAGQVHALHIDPESALLEYLSMYYKLGRAGKALDRFGVIDFATTIAPGVRDVLLTGKVYEAVQRPRGARNKEQIAYDAVVLDAPPTGRICQFLGVNSELAGLAKVGPIKSQADKVMELLRSPRTAVHLVTILEEMPVQETADGIAQLREAGLPVGGVVVNLVRPQELGASALAQVRAGAVDPTEVASDLARARVDVDTGLVESLVAEARDHAVRRRLEDEQRALVAAEGVPTYELPRLAGGIDQGALVELAQLLRRQGMA